MLEAREANFYVVAVNGYDETTVCSDSSTTR